MCALSEKHDCQASIGRAHLCTMKAHGYLCSTRRRGGKAVLIPMAGTRAQRCSATPSSIARAQAGAEPLHRGLILQPKDSQLILSGEKTVDLRTTTVRVLGIGEQFYLVEKDTGITIGRRGCFKVVGTATFQGTTRALTSVEEVMQLYTKHKVSQDELKACEGFKAHSPKSIKVYGWMLDNVSKLPASLVLPIKGSDRVRAMCNKLIERYVNTRFSQHANVHSPMSCAIGMGAVPDE